MSRLIVVSNRVSPPQTRGEVPHVGRSMALYQH